MTNASEETAAVVALLRGARRSWTSYTSAMAGIDSPLHLLDEDAGLLAGSALADAEREIADWERRNIRVISRFDSAYPHSLRESQDSPPLLFVAGSFTQQDHQGVAVVGTRHPTPRGQRAARAIARALCEEQITVVSGLAEGIDTAVHEGAIEADGRTVAVIGSGLNHCYPPQNAALQRLILASGAVVSQFWPEARPTRKSFPMRNGLMAGLSRATVIVEASATSGTRIQARVALARQRRVFLWEPLLENLWARELADRANVQVFATSAEVVAALVAPCPSELAA